MTVVDVEVCPTTAPDDTSGLEELFAAGTLDPENVIAVLGKTEGNGCVNDFSRGLATMAYEETLADALGVPKESVSEEVTLMMSGGTEGVMTPHVTVFSQQADAGDETDEKRLTAGTAQTRTFAPEELGRTPQITETARAVEAAIANAGIEVVDDVHYVQVKCPLLTAADIEEAQQRNESVVVSDTYKSMGYSRGASALGVAIATGEIDPDTVTDERVCADTSLYSQVASTSAGVELSRSEVMVLGNSHAAAGSLAIGSGVMVDPLDTDAVRTAIEAASADAASDIDRAQIRNVFAKAQAPSDGSVRGRRHVIHNDSDISATRHARAVVNATIGAVIDDPLSYVSGGAEHQGPDGGGPVAAIVEL